MSLTPIRAMLRKDLKIFFRDRRAVIMAFAMPIAIASFFGVIFKGQSAGGPAPRISVLVVDLDASVISKAIVAGIMVDSSLSATETVLDTARDRVRRGRSPVAVVIPHGFGDAAGRAFFRSAERPVITTLYDPSHSTERSMVSGILAGHVMQAVSREMFGGERGRVVVDETLGQLDSASIAPERRRLLREMLTSVRSFNNSADTASGAQVGFNMPYSVRDEAVVARVGATYNSFAHAFAGMGIQFLLLTAINFGVDILLERQRGIWKRLRSAPVSRATMLTAKLVSGAAIGALVLLVSFVFAIVVWNVRINGSITGFLGVSIACALMASAYGLLIASLGRTPNAARGVSIFATLIMVMLGGAWVPTFIFPAWLQGITVAIPTRWAMDGFDAMTWRGLGFVAAAGPIAVLLGFAAVFLAVAVMRFEWEERG